MLRYAGYTVSEDGKRYTKVYPGKSKGKSFDFLEGDQIKIGYVNKETAETWSKELHISDAFNHIK